MMITMTAVTKILSKSINRYMFNYLSGNYDCRGPGSSSSIIKSSPSLPLSLMFTHSHSLHRSTGEHPKELGISQPVKLFLNALLRKTNLNEETVLSIDGKLSDVKKRFENNEQALKNPLNGRRMNRLHSYEEGGGGGGDSGSIGSESINGSMISGVGGSAVRQKYGAGKSCFEMMMMIVMMILMMMMLMMVIMMMIVIMMMMMTKVITMMML